MRILRFSYIQSTMVSKSLQYISCGIHQLGLYVPDQETVRQQYELQLQVDQETPFPYWTKVWPAALSIVGFLAEHFEFIKDRKVLELGAGLGLPSLFSALYAAEVCCSDYLAEAVAIVQQSAEYNKFHQMDCKLLNWQALPENIDADTLLLSDVNYDPANFQALYQTMHRFLENGTTIILATPQRLMAKPFIELLVPWCIEQQEITVIHLEQPVITMVMVLKKAH